MSLLNRNRSDKPSRQAPPPRKLKRRPPPHPTETPQDDDLEALLEDMDPDPEVPREEKAKHKEIGEQGFTVGAGMTKVTVVEVRDDGSWVLDTGYVVPPKERTPAKLAQIRKQLRVRLLASEDEADKWNRDEQEKCDIIEKRLQVMLKKMQINLPPEQYNILRDGLLDDLLGFGAIQSLIDNKEYSEIMVNGPDIIFAEYKGKLQETNIVFDDDEHVYWTAQRIVRPIGRELSRANPMVDARLPDGSRVHIVSDPSALLGTTITIRKFPEKRLTDTDLINFGSFTPSVRDFMQACVVARLNIVISGGTGSGKTTLLNVMSGFIPDDERIVTIEDAAELNLAQRHVVSLETAPPIPKSDGGDGEKGRLEIRDLVKGSLRMRPDRLVIGECRGGEALDMLQAMNTGHDGSLTTVHSNSARDAISRLETLCMMSGMDLPVDVIRSQIASAVDVIIQQS
ncbi:MAG: CpaF family protein, partial [Chloroflexota bacterium]